MKIDHGLIMLDDQHCAGYIFFAKGHGAFHPDGKLEITEEQAKEHNKLLSEAELLGLDQNCAIGQYGMFYLDETSRPSIITWMGTLVSNDVTTKGKSITFRRNGRVYRGRKQKDANCFNFRRIS